ncbi:conserved hypothetical protein [Mesorhizobium plurifarium]|uniref:Uncharacterized protein n=1 Tax=Mesorhizobium plurifarium TaxID=69974 RepID=A0A090ETS4_MESPL|nr:conserved hypothetical protein [Mesorhizobium plurifarium]
MERSAEEAGFYESGRNRLVVPASASFKANDDGVGKGGSGGGSGGGGDTPTLDPIIKGLIDRLPPPGSNWTKAKRKLWL